MFWRDSTRRTTTYLTTSYLCDKLLVRQVTCKTSNLSYILLHQQHLPDLHKGSHGDQFVFAPHGFGHEPVKIDSGGQRTGVELHVVISFVHIFMADGRRDFLAEEVVDLQRNERRD